MPLVEKSVVAKTRHKRVADEYRKWLKTSSTPKTPRQRRLEMFDLLCDTAYLNDVMKNGRS
jgi:hypothetical protein